MVYLKEALLAKEVAFASLKRVSVYQLLIVDSHSEKLY